MRSSSPSSTTRPLSAAADAVDRLADLGAPGPDQAGQGQDLAPAHREADVLEEAGARQPLHPQTSSPIATARLGKNWVISRPTIAVMTSSWLISSSFQVPT